MCTWDPVEKGVYMREHIRGMHVHLEKHVVLGHTID
jgi:hypothetical protein